MLFPCLKKASKLQKYPSHLSLTSFLVANLTQQTLKTAPRRLRLLIPESSRCLGCCPRRVTLLGV